MRGRTNYTGGAVPIINGNIKNYQVAEGSTINKGDFVELVYKDTFETFVGYSTSAQRVIRLTDGTWIVAVRATTGYQWVFRALEIVDGEIVIKNTYIPTIGDGTISTLQDLQLVALDNNRFAFHALTPDTWSTMEGSSYQHCCVLLKYENDEIAFLSNHYYNLNPSSGISYTGMTPLCACSGKRIVLGICSNREWYKVLSYENDILTVLTDETDWGYYEPDGIFLKVPNADMFISIQNAKSSPDVTMISLLSNNTLQSMSYDTGVGPTFGIPNNVTFIDDSRFIILCGYENGSSTRSNNILYLLQVSASSVSLISSTKTNLLTKVNKPNTGGAIISLGEGYFVTVEGKGEYQPSTSGRVNVITLWHIDEVNTITAVDVVEFSLNDGNEISGNGFIIIDDNKNGVYVEDNSNNSNTSYFKFKVIDMDRIEFIEGNVYVKEYVRRAEGFANQSGTGGSVIEVYVP